MKFIAVKQAYWGLSETKTPQSTGQPAVSGLGVKLK